MRQLIPASPTGDLRMLAVGAGAWLGTVIALLWPAAAPVLLSVAGLLAALGAGLIVRRRHTESREARPAGEQGPQGWSAASWGWLLVTCAVVGCCCGGLAAARQAAVERSPAATLGAAGAVGEAELVLTSDPRLVQGSFGPFVVVRARTARVAGRGTAYDVRSPVVVMAEPDWSALRLGTRVRTDVRWDAPDDIGVSALVVPRGDPEVISEPGAVLDGAEAVRASLRDSVTGLPADRAALVPALVVGDDAAVSDELAEDFRATGLTHLLAVSGTNLTLMVGFVVLLARWSGVRGRGLVVVGAVGIVGFVLLARTEPSVVRAAAMGTVALLGLGRGGLRRGARALGVAVLALVLLDPWLSVSAGFGLSVLATGGILLVAPLWRDALSHWLPGWAAEAVAIPLAAQLACTPLVVVISEQVSMVAVVTNLLAAPVVGVATVLGMLAGLVGLVVPPLAAALGWLAGWPVAWLVTVAHVGADLPRASIPWSAQPGAVFGLSVLCLLLGVGGVRWARSRWAMTGLAVVTVLFVLVVPPRPGWPPRGWVVAACDVGQGDAVVLNAGPGAAVVVDAGPDPAPVDRCLDSLGVTSVPLLVLTHFHADHIGGVGGVVDGREVSAVLVTGLAEPAESVEQVTADLGGLPTRVPVLGEQVQVGQVQLQVIGPVRPVSADGADLGEEGSAANDASLVVLAQVDGVRILLTGDIEPTAQSALARTWPGLAVDVIKVPHHGSAHQDFDWLAGLGARVALISVGADNDYGHPAPSVLDVLAGLRVLRTDEAGDVAVVRTDTGGLATAEQR